jgi:hypothetical protein
MDKSKPFTRNDLFMQPEMQLREIEYESSLLPDVEGIHKGMILMDGWGNEWDDTDDFGELDFRLVDGENG